MGWIADTLRGDAPEGLNFVSKEAEEQYYRKHGRSSMATNPYNDQDADKPLPPGITNPAVPGGEDVKDPVPDDPAPGSEASSPDPNPVQTKPADQKKTDPNAPPPAADPNAPPPAADPNAPPPAADPNAPPPAADPNAPPPAADPNAPPPTNNDPIDVQGTVPDANMDVFLPKTSGTLDMNLQTNWDVTKEQTVMGQLEKNYDRNSPFFDLARERAKRAAQAGGGQNSAMAAAFGEMAAMDTAFKASFQDAQTYARSAEFNAAMANQYGLAEQRFIQNAMLSQQNFEQAVSLQSQRIAGQLEVIRMDFAGRGQLMDKEQQNFLARMAKDFEYALGKIDRQGTWDIKKINKAGEWDMKKIDKQGEWDIKKIDTQGKWSEKVAQIGAGATVQAAGIRANAMIQAQQLSTMGNFITGALSGVLTAGAQGGWTPDQYNQGVQNAMNFIGQGASFLGNFLGMPINSGPGMVGGSSNWWQWGTGGTPPPGS